MTTSDARDGLVVMPGAYLADGVVVGRDVIVEPGAVVLAANGAGSPTTLESGAVIGANATIVGGVVVGQRARVEPGSVVNRSVPPLAIVDGNPARIVGYVDSGAPTGRADARVPTDTHD